MRGVRTKKSDRKAIQVFMRRSVTLCAECEQQNPIEKPLKVLYASERHVVRGVL